MHAPSNPFPSRPSDSPPGALHPYLLFAAFALVLGGILRGVLWLSFGDGVELHRLPGIFGRGLGYDLIALTALLLPLSVTLFLLPQRFKSSRAVRALFALGSFGWIYGVTYLAFVEYYFFEEFTARLNLVAVDYLLFPQEVLINLWESYPVTTVLLINGAISLIVLAILWPRLAACLETPRPLGRRAALLAAHIALVVAVFAVFGVRPVDAGGNRIAEQLEENGILTFYQALATNEIDYVATYRSGDAKALKRTLCDWLDREGARLDHEPTRLHRHFEPTPGTEARRPNLVLVLEESFGAEFVGAYGDDRGLTPHFDALAEEGLLFRNAYATGTRTVRGIEAILTSLPPIPTVSILRRPGSENVANLGAVLRERGYRTHFFYGGYSYFDNMQHFFTNNGFEVHDRKDVPGPKFANIWGISDEDLFDYALRELDAQKAQDDAPFLAVILTTSNHKPFTFPPGVPGVPEEGGGRLAGLRYADHAIGRLFAQAPSHAWADSTLFTVVADHGARVYGAAEIPLKTYEIPLLMWWPSALEPRVVDTRTSQVDIAPTLLGLLGESYEAPFFGQNVLRTDSDKTAVLLFNHDHDVGLLRGDELVVLGLNKHASAFEVDLEHATYAALEPDPELLELTVAYYQTAFDLFHEQAYR